MSGTCLEACPCRFHVGPVGGLTSLKKVIVSANGNGENGEVNVEEQEEKTNEQVLFFGYFYYQWLHLIIGNDNVKYHYLGPNWWILIIRFVRDSLLNSLFDRSMRDSIPSLLPLLDRESIHGHSLGENKIDWDWLSDRLGEKEHRLMISIAEESRTTRMDRVVRVECGRYHIYRWLQYNHIYQYCCLGTDRTDHLGNRIVILITLESQGVILMFFSRTIPYL